MPLPSNLLDFITRTILGKEYRPNENCCQKLNISRDILKCKT
jgi:hypothetical protein